MQKTESTNPLYILTTSAAHFTRTDHQNAHRLHVGFYIHYIPYTLFSLYNIFVIFHECDISGNHLGYGTTFEKNALKE